MLSYDLTMSFMNKLNKEGLILEPCGTTVLIEFIEFIEFI